MARAESKEKGVRVAGRTLLPVMSHHKGYVQDARKRLNDARLAVENDLRWKEIFGKEGEAVGAKMPVYEQERQVGPFLSADARSLSTQAGIIRPP